MALTLNQYLVTRGGVLCEDEARPLIVQLAVAARGRHHRGLSACVAFQDITVHFLPGLSCPLLKCAKWSQAGDAASPEQMVADMQWIGRSLCVMLTGDDAPKLPPAVSDACRETVSRLLSPNPPCASECLEDKTWFMVNLPSRNIGVA
jgi:hypothetical protein